MPQVGPSRHSFVHDGRTIYEWDQTLRCGCDWRQRPGRPQRAVLSCRALPKCCRVPAGRCRLPSRSRTLYERATARQPTQARAHLPPPFRDPPQRRRSASSPPAFPAALQRGQHLHPRAGGRGRQAAGRAHHPPALDCRHQGPAALPGRACRLLFPCVRRLPAVWQAAVCCCCLLLLLLLLLLLSVCLSVCCWRACSSIRFGSHRAAATAACQCLVPSMAPSPADCATCSSSAFCPCAVQRDLGSAVKADDSFWTLDEGELQVQLTKAEEGATWASAIAGAGCYWNGMWERAVKWVWTRASSRSS